MKKILVFSIILLSINACKKEDTLLRVNANRKITDSYSINNITKVENFKLLADSMAMMKYFSPTEIQEMLKGMPDNIYGLYREFQTPTYKLVALVQLQKLKDEENYFYALRTYDETNKMIDHFNFASWDNGQKLFCSASLSNQYEIKRDCGGGEESWRITETGEFESVPAKE